MPISAQEFKTQAEAAGYTVVSMADRFDGEVVDYLVAVRGNDAIEYQIEFGILHTVEQAKNTYQNTKAKYEGLKGSISSSSSVELGNYSFFNLTAGGRYYVVSRIENTFILINASQEYKNEIDEFLGVIGYGRKNTKTQRREPVYAAAATGETDTVLTAERITSDITETRQAQAQSETTEADFDYYDTAITKYKGTSNMVSIPRFIQGNEITEIQHRVFEGKGLTDVLIPEGIMIIFERAFANNQLANVAIPDTMLVISHEAFDNAYNKRRRLES